MWMLLVDVSIWFKDLHALCPPLYFLFFPTCLYHAPSFSHFFITIFFRLQFDQSTHHCICEHIYFLLRMLCLFHSVEDQIHLPKSQRWGGDLLHHCLSRPLTCKVILQSFSTLGLYPPTEKPIYNQRWVFFFFFPSYASDHTEPPMEQPYALCWGKRIYATLLHDAEVTWSTTAHVTYLHLLILHVLCLEHSICIL